MEEIAHLLNGTHYIRPYQEIIRLFLAKSYHFQWPLSHLKTSIKQKCVINSAFHLECVKEAQSKIEVISDLWHSALVLSLS